MILTAQTAAQGSALGSTLLMVGWIALIVLMVLQVTGHLMRKEMGFQPLI